MRWLKSSSLPICLLSAATASTLINPFDLYGQSDVPTRPVSPRPAVVEPGTSAAAAPVRQESEVEKQLRKMYEESGREMPELQNQFRIQRPLTHRPSDEAVVPALANGISMPPTATSPKAPSRNPITGFFRRLIPGGSSRSSAPEAPPVPPAMPQVSAPPTQAPTTVTGTPSSPGGTAPVHNPPPASQPNYAPYSGQQPRRLPQTVEVPSQPVHSTPSVATAPALPPSPLPLAPATASPSAVVTPAPQVEISQNPAPPAVVMPGLVTPQPAQEEVFQPFDDEEFAPPQVISRSTPPMPPAGQETEFAPPVVVQQNPVTTTPSATQSAVESAPSVTAVTAAPAPAVAPSPAPQQAPVFSQPVVNLPGVNLPVQEQPVMEQPVVQAPLPVLKPEQPETPPLAAPPTLTRMDDKAVTAIPTNEFPDPFPEMSEEEADDELETELESPFVGLPLTNEPDFGPVAMAPANPQAPAEPATEVDPFDEPLTAPRVEKPTPKVPELKVAQSADEPVLELPMPELGEAQPQLTPPETAPRAMPVDTPVVAEAPVDSAPAALAAETGDDAPKLAMPDAPAAIAEAPAAAPALPLEELPAPAGNRPLLNEPDEATAAKMAMIRDRGGMKGLKGFCPVTLRDRRELLDARPDFSATFRGQKFHFATDADRITFEKDPARYVPAAYGADVVVLIRDKDVAEGSLDYAAWYKGQLYLFASADNYQTFIAEPAKYVAPVGIE